MMYVEKRRATDTMVDRLLISGRAYKQRHRRNDEPSMDTSVFSGCIPALMTPCNGDRTPDFDSLVRKGLELVDCGMSGVVYCGSMGDWPLLTDADRQQGVGSLCDAGVSVVVGTGAVNTKSAVSHAAHAGAAGAKGLMVIPRVLSRGTSPAAQRNHFAAILAAAPHVPAVIYNSPYYGFETRADLFFDLRREFSNLVGFKEFGGANSLSYAAEHITGADDSLSLMVGVDTQVFHDVPLDLHQIFGKTLSQSPHLFLKI